MGPSGACWLLTVATAQALSFGFDATPIAPVSITALPLLPSGAQLNLKTRSLAGARV